MTGPRVCEPWFDVWFNFKDGTTDHVEVLDVQWTLNGSWSPYGNARIEAVLDEALAAKLDPTADRETYAHINAARNLSASGPDHLPSQTDPQQQGFTFTSRAVVKNYTAGTMTIDAATFDAPVDQDIRHDLTPLTYPAGTRVEDIVDEVIGLDPASPPLGATVTEEVAWEAGVSALSFLKGIVDPTGRKLLCDENQRWLLSDPNVPVTMGSTAPRLYDLSDVIELETRSDLDASPFTDDVVVLYEWTNSAGERVQRIDTSAPSGASNAKWTAERADGRYPGAGAANRIRARLEQYRYERTMRMLWDLEVRPGIVLGLEAADGSMTQGRVSAVTWSGDGTMTVTAGFADYDTGWIPLELEAGFVPFGAGTGPRVRRVGNVVEVVGHLKPATSAVASSITVGGIGPTMFNLPVWAFPVEDRTFVCQGSGVARWAARVAGYSGGVNCGRYADGTPDTGTWLPFALTYIVDA